MSKVKGKSAQKQPPIKKRQNDNEDDDDEAVSEDERPKKQKTNVKRKPVQQEEETSAEEDVSNPSSPATSEEAAAPAPKKKKPTKQQDSPAEESEDEYEEQPSRKKKQPPVKGKSATKSKQGEKRRKEVEEEEDEEDEPEEEMETSGTSMSKEMTEKTLFVLDIDNTILWFPILIANKISSLFLYWCTIETQVLKDVISMYETIKNNRWLNTQIYFMDVEYVTQQQLQDYYLNLDCVNVCIFFMHAFLYDDREFMHLVRKHPIIPKNRSFFYEPSDLRSAFFAYAIFRCFGTENLDKTLNPMTGLSTFSCLTDQITKRLGIPEPDNYMKLSIFTTFIISSIEIEDSTTYYMWFQINGSEINSFNHKKMRDILMDYIFQKIDFAKDQDSRWNEPAVDFFKRKKFDDIIFLSHLLHHGELQLETENILGITDEMYDDYKRQSVQKTEIVNNFLTKIDRPHLVEYNVSKHHSKLHLVPNMMGKIQYLTRTLPTLKSWRIEIYDDSPNAVLRWHHSIPAGYENNHDKISIEILNQIAHKIRIYVSPTLYGLKALNTLNQSYVKMTDMTDLHKILFNILRKIIYDAKLYEETTSLAEKWGWICRCSR